MRGRSLLAALFGLVVLGVPRSAVACKCLEPVDLQEIRPVWRDLDVSLLRESVELDCRYAGIHTLRCSYMSTRVYAVDGSQGEIRGVFVPIGFYESTADVLDARVTVDGREAPLRRFEQDDCWASPSRCAVGDLPAYEVYELSGAGVDGELSVVLEAELELEFSGWCVCHGTGANGRHIVVGPGPIPDVVGVQISAETPLDRVAEVEPGTRTHIDVDAPPRWEVGAATVEPFTPRLRANLDATKFAGVWLERETLSHGPLFAGGVAFGDRGFGVRPQLRAGWELLSSWYGFGGSLALETDVRETLVLAPLFEGFSPGMLFIPSVGGGVGVPVMLLPEARPGFRLQLTVSFPWVSIVGNFDVYPGGSGWAQQLRGAVLLQLSI